MHCSGPTTLIVETTTLWQCRSRTIEENGILRVGVLQLKGDPPTEHRINILESRYKVTGITVALKHLMYTMIRSFAAPNLSTAETTFISSRLIYVPYFQVIIILTATINSLHHFGIFVSWDNSTGLLQILK